MESASALHPMSFKKKPRAGQEQVFEALKTHLKRLNIKLPTGYGKTFTSCAVLSILMRRGINRALFVFATDGQLEQFLKDAPNDDLPAACVEGPLNVVDLRAVGWGGYKQHQKNQRQIFACTIQWLIGAFGQSVTAELLKTGTWMICVDEHHHYGAQKTWGRSVLALPHAFLLVMSATPFRPSEDGAFGRPDISITYRDAVREGAVKPLRGHAYHYELDLEDGDSGQIIRMTTRDLAQEAGGEEPDRIERFRIERQMRWAPKFISPLISVPIDRMLSDRLSTGFPLQALITAICVSHAEYVCTQIREMYPELRVDWVGTGDFGRDQETNRAVLAKYCPAKEGDPPKRPDPALDVLVHVGMAGEGLDSINVSEVVHLANATLCNRTNQINGRAARYLEGVTGNISFDASSDFAEKGYIGDAIEDAMDFAPPHRTDKEPPPPPDLPPPPPENPPIHIFNIEFVGIDSGDAGVHSFARLIKSDAPTKFDWDGMEHDREHRDWDHIVSLYRIMRAHEAEQLNDKAMIAQWKQSIDDLFSQVISMVGKLMRRNNQFVDRTVIGEIAHRINLHKRRAHGEFNEKNRTLESARLHYDWLRQLDGELRTTGIPPWLAL